MAIESRTKAVVEKDKLHAELKADPTIAAKYLGFVLTSADSLDCHFSSAPDAAEVIALDAVLDGFVDVALSLPKILLYAEAQAHDKHFHIIDYKRELISSLIPKRTMVQGEITKVEWYSDVALTDKVITVDITYNRDAAGFAIDRSTTRTWINQDESNNPDTKITTKRYDINANEQLEEGQRRRQNLANVVANEVLTRMQFVLFGTYTPDAIMQKGRDFLLLHSVAWAEFVKSSHLQIVTDVALPDAAHDEWLDAWMVDDVITIRDHIIAEMTLY
jgi:hypothetical protein